MFNTTIGYSSNAFVSNSQVPQGSSSMHYHLEADQANNLGYGVGRWLRMAIDNIGNTWGNWWDRPSVEQLSKQRQIKIIRHQIRELIPELTSALNKIPKNSKDPRALDWALKRIQTISDKMNLLVPYEDEDLRNYQAKQFKPLEERISKLQPFVKDKLRSLLPILFQNMESAEKGMDGEEKKIGLNPQRISEFNHERELVRDDGSSLRQHHSERSSPAAFSLTSLNGANGFIINGINLNDKSGSSVASGGDVNGDGIGDVIVGGPNAASNAGQSYVIFGNKSSWSSPMNLSSLNGNNGFTIKGINAGDNSGQSVASAGDVNGDGIRDLIVGAPGAASLAGQSYVIFGSKSSWSSPMSLSSLNGNNGFAIKGINIADSSGRSVASAGDINGDGIGDVIVGAPGVSPLPLSVLGQSYVIFGSKNPWSSPMSLSSLNGNNGFTINGISVNGESGWSVASAGDVNGDDISDLIVGAPGASSNTGQSYVIFGSKSPWNSPMSISSLNGNNGFTINGITTSDESGWSVASAGDINGDGIGDVIVGAPSAVSARGQSYVIFGNKSPWSSTISLSSLNGNNGFTINGINPGDQSGSSVASVGDVNGDGIGDLIVGAPKAASNAGQSYVIFGSNSSWSSPMNLATLNGINGFTVKGIINNDQSGSSVASAGDVNGDGITDFFVGAPGASSGAGQSYVIFGQKALTSSSTTSSSTTTSSTISSLTTTPTGSSTNIGAIIGGVFGGIVVVGGAAALTLGLLKNRNKACFAKEDNEQAPNRADETYFNEEV